MAKLIHKSLVKNKPKPKKTMNFKVSPLEAKFIKGVAQKYTKGNVTALVRLAVKAYKPSKRDLVRIK